MNQAFMRVGRVMHLFNQTNSTQPKSRRTLSPRSLIAGIIFAALVSVLVTWAELVLSSARIGYLQLPPVAVGAVILFLGIVNGIVGALNKRWKFEASETAVVYIMCVIAAMTASHGILQKTIPLLVIPNFAANRSNNWAALFFNHIPQWAVPWNVAGEAKQQVAQYFFQQPPGSSIVPWVKWIEPCFAWSIFWAMIVWSFLCLSVIIRRQWADNEKLSFPLAQLPIELFDATDSATKRSLWREPAMWLGALIPVVYFGIDWLHQVYPAIPELATTIVLNDYLKGAVSPWNQLDYTPILITFAALGFFYLLPTDILFSIWFFFIGARLSHIALVQANIDTPKMPIQDVFLFQGYQTAAAYFVLTGYFIWIARPHLKRVWKAAFSKEREEGGEPSEMLSYKSAFWGLAGSLLGASIFLTALGMSWWMAVFELVCAVLVIGIVMARSTAEGGMLMTEVTWAPVDLLTLAGNLHGLGAANLTSAAFADHLLIHDQRGLLLTGMLDCSKISDMARLKKRALLVAILSAVVVAVIVGGAIQIYLPYTYGGIKMDYWMENLSPQSEFKRFAPFIQPGGSPTYDLWQGSFFFVVGAAITLFLVLMRSAFYWWPLHPIGYALAGSWSTIQFWFPALVAWMLKSLSIRYGGMRFYSRSRPFFLGLIIGEFGFASLSVLITAIVFWASGQHVRIPSPPFPWE